MCESVELKCSIPGVHPCHPICPCPGSVWCPPVAVLCLTLNIAGDNSETEDPNNWLEARFHGYNRALRKLQVSCYTLHWVLSWQVGQENLGTFRPYSCPLPSRLGFAPPPCLALHFHAHLFSHLCPTTLLDSRGWVNEVGPIKLQFLL